MIIHFLLYIYLFFSLLISIYRFIFMKALRSLKQYAGSPMPLTPMMPGCPPLTPNGPPYYSEPIPPAPSLSTSQSQPVFQQKLQQYQQAQLSHTELQSTHSQSVLQTQQQKQQQTHTHYTSNQYQESYPHTQTYQQPLQQQQQQQPQHPASTTYLTSSSQSIIPHYSQPTQTAQTFQLNGSQQVMKRVIRFCVRFQNLLLRIFVQSFVFFIH